MVHQTLAMHPPSVAFEFLTQFFTDRYKLEVETSYDVLYACPMFGAPLVPTV